MEARSHHPLLGGFLWLPISPSPWICEVFTGWELVPFLSLGSSCPRYLQGVLSSASKPFTNVTCLFWHPPKISRGLIFLSSCIATAVPLTCFDSFLSHLSNTRVIDLCLKLILFNFYKIWHFYAFVIDTAPRIQSGTQWMLNKHPLSKLLNWGQIHFLHYKEVVTVPMTTHMPSPAASVLLLDWISHTGQVASLWPALLGRELIYWSCALV